MSNSFKDFPSTLFHFHKFKDFKSKSYQFVITLKYNNNKIAESSVATTKSNLKFHTETKLSEKHFSHFLLRIRIEREEKMINDFFKFPFDVFYQ